MGEGAGVGVALGSGVPVGKGVAEGAGEALGVAVATCGGTRVADGAGACATQAARNRTSGRIRRRRGAK